MMKQALTLRAQDRILGFYLLLPSIIILFAIIVYPIGYSLWLSFHNLNINNPAKGQQFVGLQNYIDVIKSSDWWMSILRILYFVAADLIVGIPLGLAIALLLNKEHKGKGIVLAIVVFPYILAPIVNSLIWKLIYDPNYGLLNGLLTQLGIIKDYVAWLSDPKLAMIMLIIANLWQGTPFSIVLFLAGLKSIPKEEYEAAAIDGSSSLVSFRYITIPHLMPIIYMNVVMKTIATFKVFDIIYSLTGGGPGGSTTVVGMLIYKESFEYMKFGQGAAMSFLLLVIVLCFVIAYSRMYKEEEI
ncbi:MAG: sugar ABC transporter permease [Rectinema sp.]